MSHNRLLVWGCLTVTFMAGAPVARGQTTQPTQPAQPTQPSDKAEPSIATWQQVLQRLAAQLGGQDVAALRASLPADSVIRSFNSEGVTTVERLLAATSQARLISTRAYPKIPSTLAADLAADFKAAGEVIPENIQTDMAPRDAAAERRANDTAALWVNAVLQPKRDQPVGVLVFWPTDRRTPADAATCRAIFVLVKGQMIGGSYVVQQVTFGDPLETSR
jgi:hypothetical protein